MRIYLQTHALTIGCVLIVFSCIAIALSIFFSLTHTNQQIRNAPQLTNPDATVHTVTLTKDGFVPEELVIRLDEKVIFTTDTNTPFWPASSLHPTHDIYPEFDSKGRIIPPENWEFVFDTAGEWKYHDHINAHAVGRIIVIDPFALPTLSALTTNCIHLDQRAKSQCWDQQLQTVLHTQGLKAAFAFFVELYKTEPGVPKACHEWGHALGKASYKIYRETGELILVPEASYCGYGYFHSFIAELVKDTGQFEAVLQFCDDVVRELSGELKNVASNCVHGVGHGTTAWLLENPENWGNFQKTINEGTAVCERIYTNPHDLEDCYDGVFNELHLDLFNNLYGFDFASYNAKDDPFWICNEQKDAHKRACYFEFVGIFWSMFDLDFEKALAYVVENTDDLKTRGPNVIAKIAADWIQFDIVHESQERNIAGCRTLPAFLFNSCMQGIANGFIQHGEPQNLHTKGFAFCSASYLFDHEKQLCFDIFLQMLLNNYSHKDFVKACTFVPEVHKIRQCNA